VSNRAAVSIAPNPLNITLLTGQSGTGTVTLTNGAAPGGAQVLVTNVGFQGGNILTYFFNAGPDNCTGVPLAPGASCTVTVRFTTVFAARGVDRAGTITFTDNATGNTQSAALIGHAN
jgi:hypothetical protein